MNKMEKLSREREILDAASLIFTIGEICVERNIALREDVDRVNFEYYKILNVPTGKMYTHIFDVRKG